MPSTFTLNSQPKYSAGFTSYQFNLSGRTHVRYNQDALKDAIASVLEKKGLSPDTLLKDEDPNSCKVYVKTSSIHRYNA